ncbi:hypothetical protein [Pseudomonas putida]|uniref:hypothetical protein n=1 Tax=Pseudomonas putida TaxID=303 RepID=UPI0002FAE9B2|nr:hypothetical protein [Pseudomonas putida]ANC80946.1 hypothetical protein KKK_07930 [Pseudomonas putida B6-2]
MPTENRSSNTEMVSVPPYIGLEPLVGRYYPAQCRRCGWVGSSEELTEDDAQCTRDVGDRLCLGDCDELERHDLLNIIQAMAQTAPQPHPEPIAWMFGTAFWWTKEEAERDAAATGMPMIPVGPMTGAGDIGLAREMLRRALRREDKWAFLCSGRNKQIAELRAKLAELPEMLISAIEREQERCSQEDYLMDSDDCIKVIREALADSGVPVPPDQPYQGIPGTSFQRLNALANQGE